MEVVKYKLRDIVKLLNGRAYLMPELQDEGKYRILRVGNLSGGNDSWYYSDMEFDEDKYCENGDLLYAWACNFGPHIWKEEKVIYHYHVWKLIEDKQKVDRKYLYYYLLQQTPYYLGGVNGATMVHITKQNMEKKTVFIPKSLDAQCRIASILSAYDNLIENNNRRIRLLEQMAVNLYKEWFVRFRFPGHEKAEFENGLPKGWCYKRADEAILFNPTLKVKEQTEFIIIPMEALSTSSMILDSNSFEIKESISGRRSQNGDTLFAKITPCLENGKIGLVMGLPEEDIFGGSTEFIVLRSKTLTPFYVYCLARSYHFRQTAILSMNGADGRQRVDEDKLKSYKVIQPSNSILEKFDKFISPCFKQIYKIVEENKLLSRQRDLLLPRLMSGKLEVKC